MKQKDKNIFITIIFVIIFLLVWTLTSYNSTKKDATDKDALIAEELKDAAMKSNGLDEQEKSTNLIPTISIVDLDKKILTDNTTVLIDTRSAEAFSNSHIKSSLHISEFDATRQHRTVIFITSTGTEDTITTHYNNISDTNKAYNLIGGFSAWKKSGRNIVTLDIKHTFENQAKVQFVEPRDLNDILTTKLTNKFVVIDTRRAGNYAKGHVQGALNIPFAEIERRYKEIPIAKKIYVYNTDENTSFESGVLLHDLGFIGTKTIKGGLSAWTEYGYPIVQ